MAHARNFVAAAALAAALAGAAHADENATCLRMDRLETLSYVDDATIRATTVAPGRSFDVRLAGQCGYDRVNDALVVLRDQVGRCLAPRDVLYTLDGAPCFVETVTERPAG